MAVERRPDAHEFWIGVYTEPARLELEDIELVIGDTPTDRQLKTLRRFCGSYVQAAIFVERASCMGEIRAAEARGKKASRVAGVRTVKQADPVCYDIHT